MRALHVETALAPEESGREARLLSKARGLKLAAFEALPMWSALFLAEDRIPKTVHVYHIVELA